MQYGTEICNNISFSIFSIALHISALVEHYIYFFSFIFPFNSAYLDCEVYFQWAKTLIHHE